jgi:hypothetical protein
MSLLRNAYTNRRKRRESLSNRYIDIPFTSKSTSIIDSIQEPDYILGYKSPQSKIIHLSKGDLKIGIRGIRAFWSYLYGNNPSGSPKGISTLLTNIYKINPNNIKGWKIESKGTDYKVMFTHKPKCIKILTNDSNKLMDLLMKINYKDKSIWRISYRDLNL